MPSADGRHDAAGAAPRGLAADEGHAAPLLRRSSARSGSRRRLRATTGGTCRSTSTSVVSRRGACITAVRRSRSRSTSSTTPRGRAPPTAAREAFELDGALGGGLRCSHPRACSTELGVDVEIKEEPFGVPMTTPFPRISSTRPGTATPSGASGASSTGRIRCSRSSAAGSSGKTSPVHLFWHSLDLAVTRFSGRPRADHVDADPVSKRRTRTRSSRSVSGPATTTSATPPTTRTPLPNRRVCASNRCRRRVDQSATDRSPSSPTRPSARRADPRTTLLAFCEGAYEAGARLAGWDTTGFASRWCPTPAQLERLQASAAGDLGRPTRSG